MGGAAGESTGSGRRPSSVKGVILDALIVTLIAGGVGASFAIARPSGATRPATEAEAKAAESSVASSIVDLAPIVTNLAAPSDTWVRVELSVVFDSNAGPRPEADALKIAGDSLAYLRTLTLAQLEGPVGLQNLREDLNERARIRSGGKMKELVIRAMVIQ